MSKRDLFEELNTALTEDKLHSEGKLTLKSHLVVTTRRPRLGPDEIVRIREQLNMSRGVFAHYLHTSIRTLESWEQGRSKPSDQAVTLLKLVQNHSETLSYIAELS